MFQTLSQYIVSLREADKAGVKDRKIQVLLDYYEEYKKHPLDDNAPLAVIYARYSSHNQREESIEDQVLDCLKYALAEAVKVQGVYIDKAISGRTDDRASFREMIKDAGRKDWSVVIVWKIDRFGRNRYDIATYKMKLKKQGIEVRYAKERIPTGPEGILLESMLEGLSEFYSESLSQNVKRGCHGNALAAKSNGSRPPLGIKVDEHRHYTPDPETAPIVELIFTLFNEGHSSADIRDYLNARGYRTSHGNEFGKSAVSQILHNTAYIGTYKYADVIIENAFPAVVSRELWDEVQSKLGRRSKLHGRKKNAVNFILTTKIFCGGCGSAFLGESGTSHTGKVYRYYKCIGRKLSKYGNGCTMRALKKKWIEDVVVSEAHRLLHDKANIAYLVNLVLGAQEQDNDTAQLESLQAELAEVERELQNLLRAIEQGIITPTTKERMFDLESQKARLCDAIREETSSERVFTEEEILFFLERWRDGDAADEAYRQNLVDTFINAVYVFSDKIVIVFNFCDDGGDRVELREVECSLEDSAFSVGEGSSDVAGLAQP